VAGDGLQKWAEENTQAAAHPPKHRKVGTGSRADQPSVGDWEEFSHHVHELFRAGYNTTVGMEQREWRHPGLPSTSFRVLDFAGQPEYYVSHKFFLSDLHGIFVIPSQAFVQTRSGHETSVTSNPDMEDCWRYWTRFLTSLRLPGSYTAPIHWAATFCDLGDAHANELGLRAQLLRKSLEGGKVVFPQVGQIDYDHPDTVRDLRAKIVESASKYVANIRIPGSYVKLLRAVEGIRSKLEKQKQLLMLGYTDFCRCSLETLPAESPLTLDAHMFERALLFLEGVGEVSILSTGEQESKRTVILDPIRWFSRLLTYLVQHNRDCGLLAPDGTWSRKDLEGRFLRDSVCSNPQQAPTVVDLLQELDFCFQFGGDADRYVAPSMLDPQRKAITPEEWAVGDRYSYVGLRVAFRLPDGSTYLPPGSFALLQNRLGKMCGSQSQPRLWTDGMTFLGAGDARVLVLAKARQGVVDILAKAPKPAAAAKLLNHVYGSLGVWDKFPSLVPAYWALCPYCMLNRVAGVCTFAVEQKQAEKGKHGAEWWDRFQVKASNDPAGNGQFHNDLHCISLLVGGELTSLQLFGLEPVVKNAMEVVPSQPSIAKVVVSRAYHFFICTAASPRDFFHGRHLEERLAYGLRCADLSVATASASARAQAIWGCKHALVLVDWELIDEADANSREESVKIRFMKEVQTLVTRQKKNELSLVVLLVGVEEARVRKDPLLNLALDSAVAMVEIEEANNVPSVTKALETCLNLTAEQEKALASGLQSFRHGPALVQEMMAKHTAIENIHIEGDVFDTGHFGVVKLGYMKDTNQEVVVKFFRQHAKEAPSDEPAEDVVKETINLVRVDGHPRFVTLLHVCCQNKQAEPASLVFAKAEFGNLETLYERGSPAREALLAPACVLLVARDLAEGVAELHKHDIIHRDLGARNALLDRCGQADGACVRLCDFGLARRVHTKKVYRHRHHCDLPGLQVLYFYVLSYLLGCL
jgi:hypothetical protein